MKRRTFIHVAGLAAGALLIPPGAAFGAGARRRTYGLQVATARDFRTASLVVDIKEIVDEQLEVHLETSTTYYWRVRALVDGQTTPWSKSFSFRTADAFATATEDEDAPDTYLLDQNYPNPFNPTTTIPFALAEPGFVQLKVYNVLGQEVATLVDGHRPAGVHQVEWHAQDLASGTYLYVLKAGSFTKTRRMLLVK